MKKNNLSAFSLMELMVVITILGLLILSLNTFSFNNISAKDKVETKAIKINSQLETIRNNALLGKGIGTDLIVPEKYKIDFSTSNSGQINYYYFSGSINDFVKYNFNKKISFDKFEKINSIKCLKLDGTEINNLTNYQTGTIYIEGSNFTLSGNCDSAAKILDIKLKNKQFYKTIEINTINGLLNIK